ncbi:MAG TPA: hypothetical protein VKB88_02425 [Bryobacteraceae bacterium]|nr:hypothetical protein [Bryobacteraceae bacterium]
MRCFAHVLEQNLHIALGCAVVEHASTERELPPDHGVGEVAAPRPLQLQKDPLIELVQITGVAARSVAKTENRKTTGQHLTIVTGFHQPRDVARAGNIPLHRIRQFRRTRVLDEQPQVEGAEGARQLRAIIPECEGLVALQAERTRVIGIVAEGGARRGCVFVQHASAADRQIQPLVRIERHRVGLGNVAEPRLGGSGERGESAIGRVHVQPQIVPVRCFGHLAERIERSGRGRARVRYQ